MEIQEHSNYDCIIINGDSYSAPNKFKVYGDYLGEALGIPVKNFAIPGSNNDRILRSTIEYIQDIKQEYTKPLVIIGWSFIRRLEVWYYGKDKKTIRQMPDNDQSRFITLDHLLNNGLATLEQKALINDDLSLHKQLTDFYTKLYLFGNLIESLGLDYLCFSGAKNTECPIHCFPFINSLYQVQWVTQNKNFYKLHDFCIQKWAFKNDKDCDSVTGHLSEQGHKKFAELLISEVLHV